MTARSGAVAEVWRPDPGRAEPGRAEPGLPEPGRAVPGLLPSPLAVDRAERLGKARSPRSSERILQLDYRCVYTV